MSLDPHITKRVFERLRELSTRRHSEFARRRDEIYEKCPRLRELDAMSAGTAASVLRAALTEGMDPDEAVLELRDKSYRIKSEREEILTGLGYRADALDDNPLCSECGDTGYVGSRPCSCFMKLYAEEQNAALSAFIDINAMRFDNFDFELYSAAPDPEFGISPRENMEVIYDYCADYAHSFNGAGENIFLNGEPGLGKTFLSACIAGVVSLRGYSVIYESAVTMFSRFEAERFDHSEEAAADVRRYLNCDLLIIDDLGAEFLSPLSQTSLYTVINSRLVSGRATIISSNLTMDEMRRRYSRQVMSRIEGEYRVLHLFGKDIRKIKRDVRY